MWENSTQVIWVHAFITGIRYILKVEFASKGNREIFDVFFYRYSFLELEKLSLKKRKYADYKNVMKRIMKP